MQIYTDGACSGNPGPGGWAFLILNNDEEEVFNGGGGEERTTNNRMELWAAISALESFCEIYPKENRVILHSDSKYLIEGMKEWMKNWKKNGWRTSQGNAVKNIDLWKALDKLNETLCIDWRWVKAHSENKHNNRVDSLAVSHIPT